MADLSARIKWAAEVAFMPTKIAINGFGRIGRSVFKNIIEKHPDLSLVAINDLADNENLAYLLKYDSVYGIYNKPVKVEEDFIRIDGDQYQILNEKDPANLPWKDLGVEVVLECTGLFTKPELAEKHLMAGAKQVIISAPCKSEKVPHFVLGVNEDKFDPDKDKIISMASCTTNCLAPIAKVLNDKLTIKKGLMTTIHSYTSSQTLLDAPHKDFRRGRSAALSLVPTTTGAAIAVTKTIPELKGKIDGMAVRAPTPVVSLVDFVALTEKDTSSEEVNYLLKKASSEENLRGILGIEDALLVSVDYQKNSFSAIVDMESTMVQDGNLIKIVAWYDNEWGYACRLAELAEFVSKK